jgi:hypothetical protein
MSFIKKRYIVMAVVAGAVAICSFAGAGPGDGGALAGTPASAGPKSEYSNLKVLPRNISSKALQSIMIDEFEDGLGVGCNFCHAEQKGSHRLDYASDAKPEKEIAREMMRMTMKINKKYFKLRHPMIGDVALIISCNSCHRGQPRPEGGGE